MRAGPWHARPRLLLGRGALLGGRPLVRGGVAVLGPGGAAARGLPVGADHGSLARDRVAVIGPAVLSGDRLALRASGGTEARDSVAAPGRGRLAGRGLAVGAGHRAVTGDRVAVLGRRDLFLRRIVGDETRAAGEKSDHGENAQRARPVHEWDPPCPVTPRGDTGLEVSIWRPPRNPASPRRARCRGDHDRVTEGAEDGDRRGRPLRRSFRTTRAAFLPGAPITPPPGCVPSRTYKGYRSESGSGPTRGAGASRRAGRAPCRRGRCFRRSGRRSPRSR